MSVVIPHFVYFQNIFVICSLNIGNKQGLDKKMTKLALYRSPDYQTNFESIGLSVQEKKFNIDFQDGGHLGFESEGF